MVWVYGDPPFTKSERETYKKLVRKLGDREYAERIVKLVSIVSAFRKTKFKSPSEIQTFFYFDKEKTQPVFKEKDAKTVFKLLQQKGGSSQSEYPALNEYMYWVLDNIGDIMPYGIRDVISNGYLGITNVYDGLKDIVPFSELLIKSIKSGSIVAVTTIQNVSESIGGFPGAIVAFFLTVFIAGIVSGINLLEKDLASAVIELIRPLPVIGIPSQVGLKQADIMIQELEKEETNITTTVKKVATGVQDIADSFIVNKQPPPTPTGGKRLSTYRRKHSKWQKKTQRQK
jgi:hypothetical protein